jgi:hypothetical protein
VRRAALALAREVERRIPELATTAWWKEERRGVFLDYNQNAKGSHRGGGILDSSKAACARYPHRCHGLKSPTPSPKTLR